jgi:hypothetical protein
VRDVLDGKAVVTEKFLAVCRPAFPWVGHAFLCGRLRPKGCHPQTSLGVPPVAEAQTGMSALPGIHVLLSCSRIERQSDCPSPASRPSFTNPISSGSYPKSEDVPNEEPHSTPAGLVVGHIILEVWNPIFCSPLIERAA